MRILRTPGCSYSRDRGLDLKAPQSWRELTQDQLWYVFFLLSHFHTVEEVKTYMFLRFTGIQVVRHLPDGAYCYIRNDGKGKRHFFEIKAWQIQSLIHQFDYIDTYESMGVRLERIQGFHAVDVILKDVPFMDYLSMEQYYQMFMSSQDRQYINKLAGLLYRDEEGNAAVMNVDETEQTAVFFWFSYIKSFFGKMFPHFFRPANAYSENISFLQIANAQLRALTDGDVTKEKLVEQIPCLRALTELNEKAREAEEFRKKYDKK